MHDAAGLNIPKPTYDFTIRKGGAWYVKEPGRRARMWMDPCPACGGRVTGFHGETQVILSNPQSVIATPNPACEWDEDDPDSPDCTCPPPLINPHPDPAYDQLIPVGATYWLKPCGHVTRKIRVYEETKVEPGAIGELYEGD